jgi:hypothetical protein
MSDEVNSTSKKEAKEIKYDIFLSHSSCDKDFARKIYDELKQRGLRIWFDEFELQPGKGWLKSLREAIEGARFCIVLIGRDSVSSDPLISQEWASIQYHSWKNPDLPVCSVRLENAKTPPFLQSWKSFSCSREESDIDDLADKLAIVVLRSAENKDAGMSESKDLISRRGEFVRRFAEIKKALEHFTAMHSEGEESSGE